MKVAVVTPYFKESISVLRRCSDSVKAQTHQVTHMMVADGQPLALSERMCDEHIVLPVSHSDAGATPRAIGALSAFSRGFDAVSFLDADNWYEPEHIKSMVDAIVSSDAHAVIATRTIHAIDGNPIYVDRIESNGENMVDTNCMFLGRRCIPFMSFWVTPPEHRLVSDRVFWDGMMANGIKAVRCDEPTVAYVTKWAWHYHHAGIPIPDDAVWLEKDGSGGFRHVLNIDRRD